jgi:hypothetical protein
MVDLDERPHRNGTPDPDGDDEPMNGEELARRVTMRKQVLGELLEIARRQAVAIDGGRMNELMNLLGEKQVPLTRLADLSQAIAKAASDDPEVRPWNDPQDRRRCRAENEQCEEMLAELLRLEAECEQALSVRREDFRQQLERSHNTREAVSGYCRSDAGPPAGGHLDLSSQ